MGWRLSTLDSSLRPQAPSFQGRPPPSSAHLQLQVRGQMPWPTKRVSPEAQGAPALPLLFAKRHWKGVGRREQGA